MIDELRNRAKELLKAKQVDLIIGYKRAADSLSAAPCFIDNEQDAPQLIWDENCVYNLANYIKDFPGKKVGIVAKACDVKAILVLIQENQLKRENIFIIGVQCSGVSDVQTTHPSRKEKQEAVVLGKCTSCSTPDPAVCDILFSEKENAKSSEITKSDPYDAVHTLETLSPPERLKTWEEEFSRCIRCYACRQICPMCYCPKCVADQTMPAWFTKSTNYAGNFSWNVTRAMHLAGRCIDCGECERACPVGIPLRKINKKIEKDVKELFNYAAGLNAEQKPLMSSFDKNDPEGFIK